ncbi:unnamed protein product, partial [marine sediment metagenome]
EVAEIAHQVAKELTSVHVPETLFFFERSGK